MNKKNILQHIPLSCYIKLYLLEQKIFQKIRIYHNQNFTLVNYILRDFPQFHYKLNKHYMIVSHQDNLNLNNNIAFKSCRNQTVLKNNPCKLFNQEHSYPNSLNNNKEKKEKDVKKEEQSEQENLVYYNIIVGYKQLLENQLMNKKEKNKNIRDNSKNKKNSENKSKQIKFKEKKSSKNNNKNKAEENVVELKSLNLQNPSIKKIKLLTPNNLIQLKCSKKSSIKNKNVLKKIVSNIEKSLMKNPFLKKSISYVILEEHKFHQKSQIINIG